MAHFSESTENCQQKHISVRPQNLIDFQGMAKRILSDTMNLYCFYIHHNPRPRQDLKGSWGVHMERYPHKELLQDVPVETLQDFGTIQLARLKSLAASVPGWQVAIDKP